MKRGTASVAIGLIAGSLFGTAAWAGDLPVKARPAPPAFVDSWTGFYGGLNGGYAWGDVNLTPGPFDAATQQLQSVVPGVLPTGQVKQNGGFAGGQAGYNWLLPNRVWLIGVEADIQWADVHGSSTFMLPQEDNIALNSMVDRRLDWFGTLRGRLGFLATPNLLMYATGGLAFADTKTDASITLVNPGASPLHIGVADPSLTLIFDCSAPARGSSVCYGPGSDRRVHDV